MIKFQLKNILIIKLIIFFLWSCSSDNPKVIIKTKFGNIIAELYLDQAPITTSNFIKYIKEQRFEGATFYRTVTMDNQPDDSIKIEVIQGGLFEDNHPNSLPPIEHETTSQTGILHQDGTLSMARYHPGTATTEFFICIGVQPELDYGGKRNPDGQGFAAFGKVVSGMNIVNKIHKLKVDGQYLNPKIVILDIVLLE